MSNKVRVLRIIEYTYEDQRTAEADMKIWTMPATGTKAFRDNLVRGATTIRSAILMDLAPEEAESLWFARTHPGTERG